LIDLNKYIYHHKIYSMIFIMIKINLVCGISGVLYGRINYHLINFKIILLFKIQAKIYINLIFQILALIQLFQVKIFKISIQMILFKIIIIP
jgi:hypothetical protein